MKLASALAIYLLFWVMSAFFVLPFHGRRPGQPENDVAGSEPGAPAEFRVGALLKQITLVATIGFAAYYLVYSQGWINAESLGRVIAEPKSGD